jgi:hypothetical protein
MEPPVALPRPKIHITYYLICVKMRSKIEGGFKILSACLAVWKNVPTRSRAVVKDTPGGVPGVTLRSCYKEILLEPSRRFAARTPCVRATPVRR